MHLFDIIVSVFFSYVVIRGYFRGLLREAFNLFGICGGGLVAVRFGPAASGLIQNVSGLSPVFSRAISFSLIWILVYVLMFFCGMFLENLVKLLLPEWMDRIGGVVFGLLKGFFIVGLIVISLLKFPVMPKYKEEIEKTVLVKPIVVWTPRVYNRVVDIFSWSRFETFDEEIKR